MAGRGTMHRLLAKHRATIISDLDVNRVLSFLMRKGIFNTTEEREILLHVDPRQRAEKFIDVLSNKGVRAFQEFCQSLENTCPHLLTDFLLDNQEGLTEDKTPTQALQLGFELALKERDAVLRENARTVEERDQALRHIKQIKTERDQAVASLENLTGKQHKISNTKLNESSPVLDLRKVKSQTKKLKEAPKASSMESDTELVEEMNGKKIMGGDNVIWETHKVLLSRVPHYGFGIAVSGGKDNPHFANGDPCIAISDVLKAGPAEGRLQMNDRVLSVNGVSLENVDHATAISVLKDSGNNVHLVIRRRVVLPSIAETETPPLKVSLSKRSRKDEYGVVLGCRYFIKEITGNSLAAQEGGLKEGDTVLKINNSPVESLSLVDAKKLIEKTKDKLHLVITKKKYDDKHKRQNSQLKDEDAPFAYNPLKKDKDDINIYRPVARNESDRQIARSEADIYKSGNVHPPEPAGDIPDHPRGAYPGGQHSRYDGRYIYDNEAPPRPPLPPGIDSDIPPRPPSPGKSPLRPDDYYGSPKDDHFPDRHGSHYDDRRQEMQKDGYPENGLDDRYKDPRSPNHERFNGYPENEADPGRRYPEERYIEKRKDIRTDPRQVSFVKEPEMGLGLFLAGGNVSGIFIGSVQTGTKSEAEGLTEGDQILKANNTEITGMTKEEAVNFLIGLEGMVTLVVQYRKEEYDRIMSSQDSGDSFYVKTHYDYNHPNMGELGFNKGEVLHVKDTLHRGIPGNWFVARSETDGKETQRGIIPNLDKAEKLALFQHQSSNDKENNTPAKHRGGSIFKRKSGRRAKSLGKDHWEEMVFANIESKFSAYERVVFRHPGFIRPVVIFGAMADVARERLCHDYPAKYDCPQSGGTDDLAQNKSAIIKLGEIREIINKHKHCVLDVMPHDVDRLNYAQYYPIVIFLKVENKTTIKELRSRWAKGSTKTPKKLLEWSQKLEQNYQYLFTVTIPHNNTEMWYKKLQDTIESQQKQQTWISDKKPADDISDDFLFPMSNRLSFAASPESELDLRRPMDDLDVSPKHKKRLVRSSSDPSVATMENIPGIPPYPGPPRYPTRADASPPYEGRSFHNREEAIPELPLKDGRYASQSEDRYYPSFYADSGHTDASRAHIDPYATLTPSERLRNRSREEDRRWVESQHRDRDNFAERYGSGNVHPRSDRGPGASPESPNSRQNGPEQGPDHRPSGPSEHKPYNDSSSYSSDSYSKYTSNPANKHDDSKLQEKFGTLTIAGRSERSPATHDPYRFTRSTSNPVNTANIDKAKISDLSSKYRKDDQGKKPVPPKPPHVSRSDDGPPPVKPKPDMQEIQKRKKEPPPVPVKTYTLLERGVEPDDFKMRNYENSNRHSYTSPYGTVGRGPPLPPSPNRYKNLPPESEQYTDHPRINHPRHKESNERTLPAHYNGPVNTDQPRVDRYSSLPRKQERSYSTEDRYAADSAPYERPQRASYANQTYMSSQELDRFSHSPASRFSAMEREIPETIPAYPSPVERPRTDDELHDMHRKSRASKNTRSSRARSELDLSRNRDNFKAIHKFGSMDLDANNRNSQGLFESYKKLITPVVYNRKEPNVYRNVSRENSHPSPVGEHKNSAFETYKKSPPMSTFGNVAVNGSSSKVDLENGKIESAPDLSERSAPHLQLQFEPEHAQTETEAKSDKSGDGDGSASESVSTPETVITGMELGDQLDEKHTVVATARGVFDHDGGILESKETGVSIMIPHGAIPDGVEQEIYFKVCKDNSILPPLDADKGETLLSPLVMCGPHGLKFLKPVELRLPHCASVNPESWSFALKSSDSPTGHPTQWQNMSLAGMDGVAPGRVGKKSVSVLVDHF